MIFVYIQGNPFVLIDRLHTGGRQIAVYFSCRAIQTPLGHEVLKVRQGHSAQDRHHGYDDDYFY